MAAVRAWWAAAPSPVLREQCRLADRKIVHPDQKKQGVSVCHLSGAARAPPLAPHWHRRARREWTAPAACRLGAPTMNYPNRQIRPGKLARVTPRQCSRGVYSLCETTDLIAAARKSAMEASSNRQIETGRVIVTEWRFAPGAETGFHVHHHDYVVVPLVTGVVRVVEPSGDEREVEMLAGASYARPAGVAHNLINTNEYEFGFVEVELRESGPVTTS